MLDNIDRQTSFPRRVMAYCHDSVGIGHLRRTLAICERIGRRHPETSFLIATGTPYASLSDLSANIDFIKLPALRKDGKGKYGSKLLSLPINDMINFRKSMLLEVARSYKPDLLLADKAPAGVVRELVPTLRWLKAHRPQTRTIFGMRDVEDEPQATIRQWARDGIPEVLESCYDEIWVYGMRELFDVVTKYELTPAIRNKLRYMGFISRMPCDHELPPTGSPSILVTVGGGTDGEEVLATYLAGAADRAAELGVRSVVIGGPDLPRDAAGRLRTMAAKARNVEWLDVGGCMSCRMRAAGWIVTMGGYNTLCEMVRLRKPALVIPRTVPRLEQKVRAEIWQERGLLRLLADEAFGADGLADEVARLIQSPPTVCTNGMDLDGLGRVSARFDELWAPEASHATAVRV